MKSAGSIRQLDPSVVSRIAAGEAISCPSNAIKELIENSIDANSSRIIIEVERGGYDLIRIIDDGCGINFNDLPIACRAHTTSKISQYSDLQQIGTFGFRGEALHSISMVTHLKIITRTDKDEVASSAEYNEGELSGQIGFIAATKGTTIEARSLFYNYTMRLQGINPNAEAKKITDIISKYSVIYPQVSFVVRCNKKETLMTYGQMSTSETVLKLLYGFDDLNFFRCSFEINDGYFVELFLSEPNTKVKKKTHALFINGRLVKNDLLIKGIEEAYTKNSIFGSGVGSLQFCFIRMTVPPNNVDVNIHPKKEKVKFLNEKETINNICEKVKAIVNERSKKTNSGSKTNSIYNAFYKKPKESQTKSNNLTIIQAFSSDTKNDIQNIDDINEGNNNNNEVKDTFSMALDTAPPTAIISQADPNVSFSTKNYDSNINTDLNDNAPVFSLNLKPNINSKPIISHNSSRVPTITSISDFSLNQKKIDDMKIFGNTNVVVNAFDDGEVETASAISSLPTVSSSSMSPSPVRSSLFAAFNPAPKSSLSQLPKPKENTKKKENTNIVAQSQKPTTKSNNFHFLLDDDELDDFNDDNFITAPNIKSSPKKQEKALMKPKKETAEQKTNSPDLNVFSHNIPKPPAIEKVNNSPDLNVFSPNIQKSSAIQKVNNSSDLITNTSDFITTATTTIAKTTTENNDISPSSENLQKQSNNSLYDLMSNKNNTDLITDLPSFTPELQKKAIESIEKKNNSPPSIKKNNSSSTKPKEKTNKTVKGLRSSVFDDLKYDPTSGSQSLNLLSSNSSQSRHRTKQNANKEDTSMKKLEDLFSNVGDNMKRKFRVVKLLSIINMRKKREEEADLELKRLFHSNRMELVGFIGTKSVIFTAPTNTSLLENNNNNNNDFNDIDDIGIVPLNNDENTKVIYIFNLFALMKDLLKHKFLELFSNLPTFNVEISIDDVTKSTDNSKKSVNMKYFFDNNEMKQNAKQCLDEKKDMLLEYFSIFYKNGMIKAMPDVIRGYRPSFSSFPLFLEKLITVVDWEDEVNCFEGVIEQLAQLYSILPDDVNEDNQKVLNNLLLQFKAAVLPELADDEYWPNISLRTDLSFVTIPMPSTK